MFALMRIGMNQVSNQQQTCQASKYILWGMEYTEGPVAYIVDWREDGPEDTEAVTSEVDWW